MLVMLAIGIGNAYYNEAKATPALAAAGVHAATGSGSTGGNLSEKEQRFGIANSALWSTATTAASNGSVNAAQEAYTGFGGMTPLVNMMTGEVIFGGVGSGLYGMLLVVLLTVFLAGLMVGRTPEYLGKKIQAREVKLVAIGTLYMPVVVLIAAALAIATPAGKQSIYDAGPQGFSETVYAYTSQTNNNGSAFAGYTGFVQPNAPGNQGATGVPFADLTRRPVHAARPFHPAAGRAGGGRIAGGQATSASRAGNVQDGLADLPGPARRRDRDRGRAELPAGPRPRPDRPGPHQPALLADSRRQQCAETSSGRSWPSWCSPSASAWSTRW